MKKDDGVTSVVGEMLLLVIALVLVSVFAVSLFGVMPGERDDIINVAMNTSGDTVYLCYKGGDQIAQNELSVIVYNRTLKRTVTFISLTDINGNTASSFDLGGCLKVNALGLSSGDEVLLTTKKSVIYSGVIK
ncbi:MAG: hypothetical protein ALMCE001_14950 [Methanocorpusculum sp. MCE]|nr:MAG: hypothetical protein ALMCE001_14950 [Methanocorpusculum sp. MCE]